MFGYIRAYKPDMRVKEYEIYKAVYCTLCKQLGKSYGPFARLTLSYDFTFLALLQISLAESCTGFEQKRCAFNPLKKCTYCKKGEADLDFSASAAMIMLYYKLRDNIEDSGFLKRLGYSCLLPFFSHYRKKAAGKHPDIDRVVKSYITAQNKLESENCSSLDKASEPTAIALSAIFAMCANTESDNRVLERLGYCAGKWVYLVDAAADLEEDYKSRGYNPLLIDNKGEIKDIERIFISSRNRVEAILNVCVSEAGKALELLNINHHREILENIIYLGLPNSQKTALSKGKTKEKSA